MSFMPKKIKIEFVCLGNICRSPMAEFVFRKMAEDAGVGEMFEVSSSATSSEEEGNPVYPPAARKLREKGIDCRGKQARQLTRKVYDESDYVIGMETRNLDNIRRLVRDDGEGKLFRLLDFVDKKHPRFACDVADPWYTGDFDTAYSDIELGCQSLLSFLGVF